MRWVAANGTARGIPVRDLADVYAAWRKIFGGALQADAETRSVYSQTCHVRFAPNSDRQADVGLCRRCANTDIATLMKGTPTEAAYLPGLTAQALGWRGRRFGSWAASIRVHNYIRRSAPRPLFTPLRPNRGHQRSPPGAGSGNDLEAHPHRPRATGRPPARLRASSTRPQRAYARLRRAPSAFTRVFDAPPARLRASSTRYGRGAHGASTET
jgi:hypothetical protein